MQVTNPVKLLLIGGLSFLIVLIGGLALLIGRTDLTGFIAICGVAGPFIGYLVGNGVAARNDQESTPAIGVKDPSTTPVGGD